MKVKFERILTPRRENFKEKKGRGERERAQKENVNGSIIRGNKILGIISAIVEISADTTPTRYFIPNLSKDQLQQPLSLIHI